MIRFSVTFAAIILSSFLFSSPKYKFRPNLKKNPIDTGQKIDKDCLRVMFYNVENLFDTLNDPKKKDDDFTPGEFYDWSGYKYRRKVKNISKVIFGLGNPEPPGFIGFCEVENKSVLEDVFYKTALIKYNYHIVHEESQDRRGIDVAFAYKRSDLLYVSHQLIDVELEKDKATRGILYMSGMLEDGDTLHFFINHWPSRRGGKTFSEKFRLSASSQLAERILMLKDSIGGAKIIVMGDFNDTPKDRSITQLLEKADLINLASVMSEMKGTHYYKNVFEEWSVLDQMLVSKSLIQSTSVRANKMQIFDPDWLKNEDGHPYRSFKGPVYIGGYSDHFPVYIDLEHGLPSN